MRTSYHYHWLTITVLLVVLSCAPKMVKEKPKYDYSKMDKSTVKVHKKVEKFLEQVVYTKEPVMLPAAVRIDSLKMDEKSRWMAIYFNRPFSYPAYRPHHVAALYQALYKQLGGKYRKWHVVMYAGIYPLEELVPNMFRSDSSRYDWKRMPKLPQQRPQPLVRRISRPIQPEKGLLHRVIDVRPSHGWYYNQASDRWEWQRPRMFQTVEDLLPYSFVVPYLLPMLENAGAIVFMPRERDVQTHEVIVDEDMANAMRERRLLGNILYEVKSLTDSSGRGYSLYRESYYDEAYAWRRGGLGFAAGMAPYALNVNPFTLGGHRIVKSDTVASAQVAYIPYIPESGDYAVYVSYASYANSAEDARYTVYHAGGISEFMVNQQIGGGTWIYLGTFRFHQGLAAEKGQVVLTNQSSTAGRIISTDAVRFGGGMGDILRNGNVSGRPRFAEGSKYYLQYAGMPDTLIYNQNQNKDDYKDDYVSRSEYMNYLFGAPFGPKKNRLTKGLGIPFDVSFAFHTDAGISHSDTTIGTLAIYSSQSSDSLFVFPDSVSRLANRDLADVLQTQIVEDVRKKYDPKWNRRSLMDALYSEAVRPNVPSMLLELLSHQNFLDMKFALDPRFRFDVARSLYKGILKYIAFQNRCDYVVQPLPIDHFQAQFTAPFTVTLKWRPQQDPLEPSAIPTHYIVYTRIEDGGFDNGQLTDAPQWTLSQLQPGIIYSFKVTAVNQGGESMPSEILSVCYHQPGESRVVLIVNAFDRICAPAWIDGENFAGFADFIDQGVPDRYTVNYTGRQIDFSPASPYRSNDAPGHGASQAQYETHLIAGNTFDYPYAHGVSIANAGYSFVSCSDEALMDGEVDITQYRYLDLILGEEKTTRWPTAAGDSLNGLSFQALPPALQRPLARFLEAKGNLFISGAYIGSDLCAGKKKEHPDVVFANKTLRFAWASDHASADGRVSATAAGFFPRGFSFKFNTQPSKYIYSVESPDAIDPTNGAKAILRYQENQFCAATAYKKDCAIVAFGFPFETILSQADRDAVMRAVLAFFEEK